MNVYVPTNWIIEEMEKIESVKMQMIKQNMDILSIRITNFLILKIYMNEYG